MNLLRLLKGGVLFDEMYVFCCIGDVRGARWCHIFWCGGGSPMPSENVVNASVDYVQWFGEKKSCQMNLEEVSV